MNVPNLDAFGGTPERTFDATGFFRLEQTSERWWLVDPEGYAFWSAGQDCVSPAVDASVAGLESALTWLPEALPGFTYHDPKVIATVLVWILYAAAVVMKYLLRVDQRRFVILSLIGFAGLFLSMTIVNLVLSGFHDFR